MSAIHRNSASSQSPFVVGSRRRCSNFCHGQKPNEFLISCIVLLSDQKDILLGQTELQLGLCLSTYSVPTPPLQPFLQPVLPGQGGVWDLDTITSSSSASSYQNAVEEEDVDALQEE